MINNKVSIEKYSLKQRLDLIKNFCLSSNIEFVNCENSDIQKFQHITLRFNDKEIHLHAIIKNIVNSGWASKPFIKRIQIPSLLGVQMHINSNNIYSVLIGLINFDNEPIMVVRNPFRFTFHKTNRSCYVYDESIKTAVCEKNGFYRTVDSEKEIIICDQYHFKDLLIEYIERNGF